MNVSGFEIGESRVFVIAEIGNNHNGDYGLAKEMVESAIAAGADCVKFQMRDMDESAAGQMGLEFRLRFAHQARILWMVWCELSQLGGPKFSTSCSLTSPVWC